MRAALGLSVLIFIRIGGSGGLVFFMPFLMFIFLLALGEDYNILVMTRIREEARQYPLREAVTRARNLAAHVPGDFINPQMELLILLPQAG